MPQASPSVRGPMSPRNISLSDWERIKRPPRRFRPPEHLHPPRPPPRTKPLMKYRKLGSTGLEVSEIGFGAWAIGGNQHGNSYGPTDDEESISAITAALDHGCTFFDTADVYGRGHSEELLGQALKGRRSHVVLATKGGSDFYHEPPRLNFTEEHLTF